MDRAEEHSRSFSSAYEKDKSSSESSSLNSIRRRISMFGEKNIKSIQTQDADPRKSTPPPHIPQSTQFRSQMKRDNPELSSAIRTTCETGTHIKKRRKLNLFQKIDLSEDTDDRQLDDNDSPIDEHNSNGDAEVKEEFQSTPPSSLSTQRQQQQQPPLPLQSLSHRKSIFDVNRVKLESPEREFKSARKTLDGRYTKEREEFAVKEEPMSDNDDMDVTGGEAPGTPETDRRLLLQRSGKKMEPKPFNTGNKRVSRVVMFPAELQRVKEEVEEGGGEEVRNDNDDSGDDEDEDTNEESDNNNGNDNITDKIEVKKEDEEKRRIKNEKDPFIPSANGKIKNNFSFVPNRFSGISGARQPSPSSDQLKIAQQQKQQQLQQQQLQQQQLQQQQQQLQQINSGYQVQHPQFPQQLRQQMQQAQFQQQHPQQIIGAQQLYPIQPQQAPQQFYGMPRVQQQPFYYVNISQTPAIVNPMIKPDHLPFIEFINKHSVITIREKSYLELEVIGRGASSCVKKVLGEDFKMYALKSVRCKEIGRKKLEEEVGLMEKLRSCNLVIALIASEINDDLGHIVMELGDSDLSKLLADSAKKDIDFNLIRIYWKQMLDSVNAVHEEGIIHADLKPQNFVLVNGTLKLIDFGISKQMNQDSTHVTMGLGVGTPNYLPPESLNHGNFTSSDTKARVTKAADTWSLGCILYQMAYGKAPFQDYPNNEKYNAIVSEKYKIPMPPTTERDGSIITLPPSLIDVLERCLKRDPKLRLSINELLNHPFLTGNTFCPRCISPPPPPPPSTTSSSTTTTGNNGKNNGKGNEATTTTTTTTNTTTNRTSTMIKGRTGTITKSSTTTKSSTSTVKTSGVRSNIRGSSIKK